MSVFDLFDDRFEIVGRSRAGHDVLSAFSNPSKHYCAIGNRWLPGDHAQLVNRDRLIGDLVDLTGANSRMRNWWEELLRDRPELLRTFIAGGLLKELPQFDWGAAASIRPDPADIDLGPKVVKDVEDYLADYLGNASRISDFRAEVVDIKTLDFSQLATKVIAVDDAKIIGVFDQNMMPASTTRNVSVSFQSASPSPSTKPFIAHPRLSVEGGPRRKLPFQFRVGFSDRPDEDADEQRRIHIDEPQPGESILVIASAEGATVEEPSWVELPLEMAAEHEFTAKIARDVAIVSLRASYIHRNKAVGSIVKSFNVEAKGDPKQYADAGRKDRPRDAARFSAQSSAGKLTPPEEIADVDIILYVEKGEPGHISWRAFVPNGSDWKFHGPWFVPLEDSERFAKSLAKMRSSYGDAGDSAMEELAVTGQLIAELIPAKLKDDVLFPALVRKEPPAIMLMTDQPFIPWELARFGPRALCRNEPAFLGEIARVGRWWTSRSLPGPRSHRLIETVSAVAATEYALNLTVETLECARAERDWLSETYGARPVEAKLPEVERWLDTAPRPRGHLGHIALHGYSEADADAQGLILGDGKVLTPNRLAGQYYDGDTPRFEILFLNACQVGTAGERLGRVAGFPGAILGAGASAFIGPLWEVKDDVAQQVAQVFYEKVLGEQIEVGEALRQMRSKVGSGGSITPWAYLFYGHPRLTLALAP